MQEQSSASKNSRKQQFSHNSKKKDQFEISRNLFALIGESSYDLMPYRSKFQLNSIGSGKSRQSRDSDLLNRLAKQTSSKASSKSLSRNVSFQYFNNQKGEKQSEKQHKSHLNSEKSNSIISDSEQSFQKQIDGHGHKVIETEKMIPKIHNCVCSVAGQCLGYNCNCFLSPYPCAPDCCQNCLTLKSSLPLKFTNNCSCKKTRCLKLYCECLAKGLYCNVLCKCQLCENHELSVSRIQSIHNYQMYKGCSCQKSNCKKKYCDCFAQGIKCTNKCVCIDCHNFLKLSDKKQDNHLSMMDEQKFQNSNQMQEQRNEGNDEMQFEQIDFFGSKKK